MRNAPLGRTDIEVSVLCLGTMHFGTVIDPEISFRILDRYVETGGGFVDTANNYATWVDGGAGGESESLIGRWIKDRKNRSDLFVATKVGFPVPRDGVGMGLSARQVEGECNRSLKRLGIETIDLYYAHQDDRKTPLEESLEAYHRLVKTGKVRFIGASNYLSWRLEEARWISRSKGWPEFCCIQQRYSYLRPRSGADFDPQVAVNTDLLDLCRSRKMSLLAYSPLLRGAYGRTDRSFPDQYAGSDSESRLTALRAVALELGATGNQTVLAWLVQSEPMVIPVLGVSSTEQLDENLGSLKLLLSEDQIYRLSTAGNIASTHTEAKRQSNRMAK
jgi:aryl-alcohol dehydrogenase-like predicted oxidoreductase